MKKGINSGDKGDGVRGQPGFGYGGWSGGWCRWSWFIAGALTPSPGAAMGTASGGAATHI